MARRAFIVRTTAASIWCLRSTRTDSATCTSREECERVHAQITNLGPLGLCRQTRSRVPDESGRLVGVEAWLQRDHGRTVARSCGR
jgi:1,2-phenylacetyl-CoA epoxidase PaaB subunit